MNRTAILCFLFFLATSFVPAHASSAQPTGQIVAGNARFTVITPNCIRIEYSPTGKFIDQPSLFAVNRSARWAGYRLSQITGQTIVDTGAIKLTYRLDSYPLGRENLFAEFRYPFPFRKGWPSGRDRWTPGQADSQNLGGTLRTLDGLKSPVDLGQGLLSRSGWALVDDSKTPLFTRTGWVESRPTDADIVDWYLFGYGKDYHTALKSLAVISGPVPLPRRYTMGSWYSRYWPYSSDDYRRIVREYAEQDFPLDNMVMDMDWHITKAPDATAAYAGQVWTGYTWNRDLLPDAESLLAWFHQQGLHVTLNDHPADGVWPHEEHYSQFMRALGFDPASKLHLPFDAGSQAYLNAFYATTHLPLEREGVDFWWLDWQQQPYTRSMPDLSNLFWLNEYNFRRTSLGGLRGQSFSRWAGYGDQRHPIHFSGDADTGWKMLAFEVPFTSTAGNVGCFFWSHDIGGHMGGRNEESYVRWCQFGALSAALRVHSTRDATMDRRPWTYPKWAEDSMRKSFHLRSELFPYIYTSAAETCRDTVPLMRPMYFDHPDDEAAYHNPQEFTLGDNILAAPIATPGVGPQRTAAQTVWFPTGADWFDWFTGDKHAGGSTATVSKDIDSFPLYARGGVPIPMQPYTSRMATTALTTLVVRCYPGRSGKLGRSTLYEDDGVTNAYKRGDYATTEMDYLRLDDSGIVVIISPAVGRYKGQPQKRGYIIDLCGIDHKPNAVALHIPIESRYDANHKIYEITIAPRSIRDRIKIVVF